MLYARVNRLLSLYESDRPAAGRAVGTAAVRRLLGGGGTARVGDPGGGRGGGSPPTGPGLLENAPFKARMQSGSLWLMINYCFNAIIFVLLGTQLPAILGPFARRGSI